MSSAACKAAICQANLSATVAVSYDPISNRQLSEENLNDLAELMDRANKAIGSFLVENVEDNSG